MEIQQLRHLQAAANSQSYAQAAKKCFTSRQNIAHSVKALEGEVGTPLFERKGNRMVLTEEGRQVAYVVDEVLERVDRLGSLECPWRWMSFFSKGQAASDSSNATAGNVIALSVRTR